MAPKKKVVLKKTKTDVEEVTAEEIQEEVQTAAVEQFDPSLPESKQRHLR